MPKKQTARMTYSWFSEMPPPGGVRGVVRAVAMPRWILGISAKASVIDDETGFYFSVRSGELRANKDLFAVPNMFTQTNVSTETIGFENSKAWSRRKAALLIRHGPMSH